MGLHSFIQQIFNGDVKYFGYTIRYNNDRMIRCSNCGGTVLRNYDEEKCVQCGRGQDICSDDVVDDARVMFLEMVFAPTENQFRKKYRENDKCLDRA